MQISAKIIQDSISPHDKRITTFELEYPRFIHAEFMTHRQFSRNAASSRAIPISTMLEHVRNNPAMPVHWGANQSGMQAKAEVEDIDAATREWRIAAYVAVDSSEALAKTGLHKQIANRVTEPFQMMKTVCTATEWDNWFWLRYHTDAQPEIFELAKLMREALDSSTPTQILQYEWHVPYVTRDRIHIGGDMCYLDNNGNTITLEEALIISASCCAQVSYRKSDDTLDKAKAIYDRLINSSPVHASPVEHQAKPMVSPYQPLGKYFEKGCTHFDKTHSAWSANFKGWIQHRQLIPNQSA